MYELTIPAANRTGPAVLVIALHMGIVYLLAIGLGVVPAPTLSRPMTLVPVPVTPIRQVPEEPARNSTPLTPDSVPAEHFIPPIIPMRSENEPETGSQTIYPGTATIEQPAVSDARLLFSTQPSYPSASRFRDEQGVVYLRITISPLGGIGDIAIEKSSGYIRLDEAALKAVRQWRFAPAMRGTQAIVGTVIVPVRFQLQK